MSNDKKVEVRLLTLSDCDYCTWLKSELDKEGIAYINMDANVFSEFANIMEEKLKTDVYPIVFLEIGDRLVTIVPKTELETSDTLLTFDTIPELVGMIKQHI